MTQPVPLGETDPVALLDEVLLTANEAGDVEPARAANTLCGNRADWNEFAGWCTPPR